MVDYIYVLTC